MYSIKIKSKDCALLGVWREMAQWLRALFFQRTRV